MTNQQNQINQNFQERLSDLEVQQQVMTSFFSAVIQTHQDPSKLKECFMISSEYMLASAIQKPLPESFFSQLNEYRSVLCSILDQCIAQKSRNPS